MRTSALLLAVALSAPARGAEVSDPEGFTARLELGLPAELTLVGLTGGVRPELLLRVGAAGTASRLRVAVGLFAGPEQLFVPVSLGYRAVYRQGRTVQPVFGVGFELQHRLVADFHPVRSFGLTLEGGVGFAVAPRWSLGVLVTTDFMFLGLPGFGFGPRLSVTWRL